MTNKYTSRSKHLDFIILDIICVELSFFLAHFLRYNTFHLTSDYILLDMVILIISMAVAFFTECYSGILRRGYLIELKDVVVHQLEAIAMLALVLFAAKKSVVYSRTFIAEFYVINVVIIYIMHCVRKAMLKSTKQNERYMSRLLIVTTAEKAEAATSSFKSYTYGGLLLDGIVIMDAKRTGETLNGVHIVADADSLMEYVRTHVIDEVLLDCDSDTNMSYANKLVIMGVVVHIGMNHIFENMPNAYMENINRYAVITSSINKVTFKQRVIKRCMDIAGGLVGSILTLVLMVIFGPIIYIQSPGPIIFKQVRVGKNGRRFTIYKFRSMYMDAEERKKELMAENKMDGLMFKMDNDPRIIPIGRFMRKTSLDEFPQFFNILKGDMSLVGTRPPTVDEYEQYELYHKSRLAIKPGLTGMWQVSGRSDITDFEEVVRLDNQYIKEFCLRLDIKILFKTVGAVFGNKGAV